MMTSSLVRHLASLAALSMWGLSAGAQTGGPSPSEIAPPQAKKPPEQAAIDACKDKKEGDRVHFTDAKGKKRHYSCAMFNGVLAARSGVATAALTPKRK